MSSTAKKVEKAVLGGCNKFPNEMYNTTVGSLVICGIMFSKKEVDFKVIRKQWKSYKKTPDMFDLADEDFIDKTLQYFGIERPRYFPIAFVQGITNCLFAPYDKKHKLLLPLREDGFKGPTLRHGKVYPIEFNKTVKNRIWLKEKIKDLFHKLFHKEKEDGSLQSESVDNKGNENC